MSQVRLPELETIRRFSIAVRSEHADAEQVLEALQMDLDRVQTALGRRATPATSTTTKSATKRSSSRATGRSTRSR